MAGNVSVSENIDALFTKLEKFLRSDTVVGHPISVGSTTLVPIVTITFGCGTATGSGSGSSRNDKEMDSLGSGLGAGAKVTPNAILVIRNNEVTMLPVKGKNNLSNLVEMVPEILSKLDLKDIKIKNTSNQNDNQVRNENTQHRNGGTNGENHEHVNKHREHDVFQEPNDNFRTQDNQQDAPLSY